MRIPQLASLLSITVVTGACAAGPPPAQFTAADSAAITAATAEALAIANTSADWQTYADLYYAEDAAIHMEGSPSLEGRAAIVAMLKEFSQGVSDYRIQQLKVDGSGDLAYVLGESSFVPAAGAAPVRMRYIEVWKRQADGSWKVVHDIGQRLTAPEAAPAT
jgi:ketosteroid isomerase-like protein